MIVQDVAEANIHLSINSICYIQDLHPTSKLISALNVHCKISLFTKKYNRDNINSDTTKKNRQSININT